MKKKKFEKSKLPFLNFTLVTFNYHSDFYSPLSPNKIYGLRECGANMPVFLRSFRYLLFFTFRLVSFLELAQTTVPTCYFYQPNPAWLSDEEPRHKL